MHTPKMFYFTYNIIIYDAFSGFGEFSEFKQQVKPIKFTVVRNPIIQTSNVLTIELRIHVNWVGWIHSD